MLMRVLYVPWCVEFSVIQGVVLRRRRSPCEESSARSWRPWSPLKVPRRGAPVSLVSAVFARCLRGPCQWVLFALG